MTQNAETSPLTCTRCGESFGCGATTGACWCMDEDYRVPMPQDASAGCLCPACLRQMAAARAPATLPPRSAGSAQ